MFRGVTLEFYQLLDNYIKEIGCTAKQLAEKSDLSASVISRYRSGEREPSPDSDIVKKLANGIAAQAPIAVRNCKKAINEGYQMNIDDAVALEEKLFGDCFETEDQKAGMGNFLAPKEEKVKVVDFKNA